MTIDGIEYRVLEYNYVEPEQDSENLRRGLRKDPDAFNFGRVGREGRVSPEERKDVKTATVLSRIVRPEQVEDVFVYEDEGDLAYGNGEWSVFEEVDNFVSFDFQLSRVNQIYGKFLK